MSTIASPRTPGVRTAWTCDDVVPHGDETMTRTCKCGKITASSASRPLGPSTPNADAGVPVGRGRRAVQATGDFQLAGRERDTRRLDVPYPADPRLVHRTAAGQLQHEYLSTRVQTTRDEQLGAARLATQPPDERPARRNRNGRR